MKTIGSIKSLWDITSRLRATNRLALTLLPSYEVSTSDGLAQILGFKDAVPTGSVPWSFGLSVGFTGSIKQRWGQLRRALQEVGLLARAAPSMTA